MSHRLSPILIFVGAMLTLSTLACISTSDVPEATIQPVPTRTLSPQAAAIATINAAPIRNVINVASTTDLSPVAAQGAELYASSCASCHGADAGGVTGLGKPLVGSDFIMSISNEELTNFIITGRPAWDAANTTGIDMPARGGNPALTDEDIQAIAQYLRALNGGEADDTAQQSTTESSATSEDTSDETVSQTTDYDSALVSQGEQLYAASCTGCHGPDAKGIAGVGKNLIDSDFVHSQSDEQLVQFIIVGREIWDPANTTGIAMPARGGNPALTDDDLQAIVAYIRSLE